MATTLTADAPPATTAGDELLIAHDAIDPDPQQPRTDADDDLKDSLAENGQIQAITVRPHPVDAGRFMLVDGERRWRGAAGILTHMRARVRTDLEAPADRLIVQLAANRGKQVSALDEALAFRAVLDADPTLTQEALAKRLGRPRSVIGDRVRLLDLDPVWIELLKARTLQPGYAPILMPFRAVPSKYQAEVAAAVVSDYRVSKYLKAGEVVPGSDFGRVAYEYFHKHLRSLDPKAHPSWPDDAAAYEGPVVQVASHYDPDERAFGKYRFAADPDIWRRLLRQASAKRASESKKSGGATSSSGGPKVPKLPAGVTVSKAGSYVSVHNFDGKKGEAAVWQQTPYSGNGWHVSGGYESAETFDVATFCAAVDWAKCRLHVGAQNLVLTSSDRAALAKARSTWHERRDAKRAELVAELRATLDEALQAPSFALSGHATVHLVRGVIATTERNGAADAQTKLFDLVEATGVDVGATSVDALRKLATVPEAAAVTLMAAAAVMVGRSLVYPSAALFAWEHAERTRMAKLPLRAPKASEVEVAVASSDERTPKAKRAKKAAPDPAAVEAVA